MPGAAGGNFAAPVRALLFALGTLVGIGSLAGCAAEVFRGMGDDAAAPPATDDGGFVPTIDAGGGPCGPPACTIGSSRCMGIQVSQCVSAGGCLVWGAPAACPAGQACMGNACADPCAAPNVATACGNASGLVAACCGGGITVTDGTSLCEVFVAAGKDPLAQCSAITLQTLCSTLHTNFAAMGLCCCEPQSTCDPEHANGCVLECSQRSNCANDPGGPSCAPVAKNGVVSAQAMICRPDDGGAYHGCQFLANNGCASGYDCWRDNVMNEFCARSCNADSDCGNPGIACCNRFVKCNRLIGSCAGSGACMPCP
jgi:hypothetical protein